MPTAHEELNQILSEFAAPAAPKPRQNPAATAPAVSAADELADILSGLNLPGQNIPNEQNDLLNQLPQSVQDELSGIIQSLAPPPRQAEPIIPTGARGGTPEMLFANIDPSIQLNTLLNTQTSLPPEGLGGGELIPPGDSNLGKTGIGAIDAAVDDVMNTDVKAAVAKGITKSPSYVIGEELSQLINKPEWNQGVITTFAKPYKDYKPKTVTETLISEAVPFIDPVSIGGGHGAFKALGRGLPKLIETTSGAQGARVLANILGAQGLGEQLVVTAADQISNKEFDPTKAAQEVGTALLASYGLGAVGGKFARDIAKKQQFRNLEIAKNIETLFNQPDAPHLPMTTTIRQKKIEEIYGVVERLEAKQETYRNLALNPGLDIKARRDYKQAAGFIQFQKTKHLEDIQRLLSPEAAVDGLAVDVMKSLEVRVNDRRVRIVEPSLFKQGSVVGLDERKVLRNLPDITPRETTVFSLRDYARLMEKVDNSINGISKRTFVNPAATQLAALTNRKHELQQTLLKKFDPIKKTYKQRKQLIFDAAEGKSVDITPDERSFVNELSSIYSTLLDEINTARIGVGLKPIKKRANYVTHLTELVDLSEYGIQYGTRETLPFRFQHARTSPETAIKDPILALDAYLDPALKQIYLLKTVADMQARAKFLPPNLRRTVLDFTEHSLLGARPPADETILTSPIKKAFEFAEKTQAGMIVSLMAANAQVVINQASQLIPTLAQTGVYYGLRGLATAWKSAPEELMKHSGFLPHRTIKDEFRSIIKGKFTKNPADLVLDITDYADKFVAKQTWNSAYFQAKEQFLLSDKIAVKYADDIARRLHAQYNDLYRPKLLRSRIGRSAFPFQTFLFNQANFIFHDQKLLAKMRNTPAAREVIKTLGAILATNQVYNMLGLPTPFGDITPSDDFTKIKNIQNTKELGLYGVELTKNIASQLPAAGGLFYEGSNLPIASPFINFVANEVVDPVLGKDIIKGRSALENLWKAMGESNPATRNQLIRRAIKQGPLKFVPAGNQIGKIMDGTQAISDGYWKVGDKRITLTEFDKLLAPVFGPAKTPSAKKFFKQIEEKRAKKLSR